VKILSAVTYFHGYRWFHLLIFTDIDGFTLQDALARVQAGSPGPTCKEQLSRGFIAWVEDALTYKSGLVCIFQNFQASKVLCMKI
jgi:hypothetical protein